MKNKKYIVNFISLNLFKSFGFNSDFIILCLGTNKCAGDALGCLTGTLLKCKYNISNCCYGDLNNNITALNLEKNLKFIKKTHKNAKILVIDSVVSGFSKIGVVRFNHYGIKPRSYINSNFCVIGDASITGVVGNYNSKIFDLFLVNKLTIYKMADIIAKSIYEYKKIVNYIKMLN